MLQFICSIPENFGWSLVGMVITLNLVMASILISYLVQYIKDSRETEENEEFLLDNSAEICYN